MAWKLKAWHGMECHGKERNNITRKDMESEGKKWHGMEWKVKERK
jgi:hypothetical protein